LICSPLLAQGTFGVINPQYYPGANLCLQIQAAIASNASANPRGLIIDARSATGTQQCTVNPFSGAPVPGQLLLGPIILQTTAPIVTPSVNAWQILGIGRGNSVNKTGTLIQAVTGFPANGTVVRLGDGKSLTFGNRIENLTIDCNGITGTIGLYSTDIQEQSGGSNLDITSCPARELWINGSGSDGVGPQYAMNYEFHDVEALGMKAGTPATIACEFDGNNQSQPNGPHLLSGLTCSGSPSAPIATGFVFDSFSGSTITNLGAESAQTGYIIGNLAPLNGVTFSSLTGGTITGSVVHVKNPPRPPTGNVTTDIELSNIVDASGTAAALITDDVLSKTINSQRTIGTYRIGNLLPSSGSFAPGYTHFTDSPFLSSQLFGLALNNASDSVAGNVLKISSGRASTTPALVEFDDRGIPRWQIGKDSIENFELFDSIANVMRIHAVPNSNMEINAAGSGILYLNLLAGSGGVKFCNGASSCGASVNSAGAASFAGVAIPSLGASAQPLCTTAGGIITNVGCTSHSNAASLTTPGVKLQGYAIKQAASTNPSTGPLTVEQVAGAAAFSLARPEAVGGANASVVCAVNHQCDSFSGTLRLTTGSDPISVSGSEVVTISFPLVRQSLPNCLADITTYGSDKPLARVNKYANSSSLAIVPNSSLAPSTQYEITYICGGN